MDNQLQDILLDIARRLHQLVQAAERLAIAAEACNAEANNDN